MAFKEERLAMLDAGVIAFSGFALVFVFPGALALARCLLQRFDRGRGRTRRAHFGLDNSSERDGAVMVRE